MIAKKIYDYLRNNITNYTLYLYNRPTNSTSNDIVVSLDDDRILVECFTNNVSNDVTFPNYSVFNAMENELKALIPFELKIGQLVRNSNGYWSAKYEFHIHQFGNGTYRKRVGVSDGYGGVTTTFTDESCVCFIGQKFVTNNRTDIAINKPFKENVTIILDGLEYVVYNYKKLEGNFTLCSTYSKLPRKL